MPANAALHDFYAKRGYKPVFYYNLARLTGRELAKIDAARSAGCALTAAKLADLAALRQQNFADSRLFLDWPQEYLDFAGSECRFFGGAVLRFTLDGLDGYVACQREGKRLLIKEYSGPATLPDSLLLALHRRFRAKEYLFYLRPDKSTPWPGQIRPFGLIRYNDLGSEAAGLANKADMVDLANKAAPAYMAHALD